MTKLLSTARAARSARAHDDEELEEVRRPAPCKQTRSALAAELSDDEIARSDEHGRLARSASSPRAARGFLGEALAGSLADPPALSGDRTNRPRSEAAIAAAAGELSSMFPSWDLGDLGAAPPARAVAVQRKSSPGAAFDDLNEPGSLDAAQEAIAGVTEASSALPFLDVIQRSFGHHDVSAIRAQVGGAAARAAHRLGARAYATGARVAFAETPDLHTVAHEAAHVIQQASGMVPAGLGAHGDAFEQHADAVADAVVAGQSAEALLDRVAPRSAGDVAIAAAVAPAVQRQAPDYKTAKDVRAMRLREFDDHAHRQADWAISDGLGDSRERLRRLLGFARANKEMVLAACKSFLVGALLKAGVGQGGAVDAAVTAYSQGVRGEKQTVIIEHGATSVSKLIAWGQALQKLETGVGGAILQRVIPQRDGMAMLAELVEQGAVDDLITYYQTYRPALQATTGNEIVSFLEFREHGGLARCEELKQALPEIQNLHRFTVAQLDALKVHRARAALNPTQAEPLRLCVVLQTGRDAASAFYRNEALTQLLQREHHLVLLAEGRGSLEEFSADLERFAQLGADGKIDELVLTGHGNAKSLALSDSSLSSKKDSTEETERFFADVARLLRDSPESRVVLNACLTNSNDLSTAKLDQDPKRAAQQIRLLIQRRPNLKTFIEQLLTGHAALVIGANASFPPARATLLEGTRLDLRFEEDPALTRSKLEYLEHGLEVNGVLRAALEVWASSPGDVAAALHRRQQAKMADRSWAETILRAVTTPMVEQAQNLPLLQEMAVAGRALAKLKTRNTCNTSTLIDGVAPKWWPSFFPQLATSSAWQDETTDFIPLVVLQVWATFSPERGADFLDFFGRSAFYVKEALPFLDLPRLAPLLDRLLAVDDSPPQDGAVLLALSYLSAQRKNAPAQAKALIAALAGEQRSIPPGSKRLLKGLAESTILRDAGVLVAAPSHRPPPPPNVAPSYGGDNEVRVDSITRRGVAADPDGWLEVYALPSGETVGELLASDDKPVHVIGKLTWTCPPAPPQPALDDDEPMLAREKTLRDGRTEGEVVELFAVEWVGPFPTVFVEKARLRLL